MNGAWASLGSAAAGPQAELPSLGDFVVLRCQMIINDRYKRLLRCRFGSSSLSVLLSVLDAPRVFVLSRFALLSASFVRPS